MSDFIIVLAVAILGLLAQAAGGKKKRRLVVASPTNSFLNRALQVPAQPLPTPIVVESATQSPTNYPTDSSKAESASPSAALEQSKFSAEPSARAVTDNVQPTTESASAVPSSRSADASPAAESADASPAAESADVSAESSPATESKSVISAAESTPVLPAEIKASDAAKSIAAHSDKIESVSNETPEAEKAETVEEAEKTVEAEKVSNLADVPKSEVASENPAPKLSTNLTTDAASTPVSSSPATEPSAGASEQNAGKSESSSSGLKIDPSAQTAGTVPEYEDYVSRKPGIEFFLRVTIFLWFLGLALFFFIANSGTLPTESLASDPWVAQCTFITCALTGFTLIKSFRTALSFICTCIESIFDLNTLRSLTRNWSVVKTSFIDNRVFIPSSIPHMVALFIFVQTLFYLLSSMTPKNDFGMPGMPIALPLPLDQLFSYNGLGLVTLAFCGAGIFVTRNFKEVMQRLALVKPTAPQVGIGFGLIFMSFLYDYLWSVYTHNAGLGLDTKLAGYNGGTFAAEGGFSGAIILALATALCAGIGEETLIRGGLQAVFGLVPAAIMHGVLHAQFQHAPIFIVQVAGWSILMGIVKKYTNTTTTIIGHAGFNFVTTFLFAFNP